MKRKQRNNEIKICKELGIEIHNCRLLSTEVVQRLIITNNTGTLEVLTMVSLKIIIPFQIHNIDQVDLTINNNNTIQSTTLDQILIINNSDKRKRKIYEGNVTNIKDVTRNVTRIIEGTVIINQIGQENII